jgi:hypothetical protein
MGNGKTTPSAPYHERRAADLQERRGFHLESDSEEQKKSAEFRESSKEVGWLKPVGANRDQ